MRNRDLTFAKQRVSHWADKLREEFGLRGLVRVQWTRTMTGWQKPWPLASTRYWRMTHKRSRRFYTISLRIDAVGNREHAITMLAHEFAHVLQRERYGRKDPWHSTRFYRELHRVETFLWSQYRRARTSRA